MGRLGSHPHIVTVFDLGEGEGGKKKVYLAHDELLDRDVAFALIKTEGLDDRNLFTM